MSFRSMFDAVEKSSKGIMRHLTVVSGSRAWKTWWNSNARQPQSVVEQPGTLFDEGDAQLICGVKDCSIVLTADRTGNVLDTRPGNPVNVVDEREL